MNILYLYLYLFRRYSHIKLLFISLKFSFYVNLELLVGYFKKHSEFLDNIFRKFYLHKSFVPRKFQFCRMPFGKLHFCRMPFETVFLTAPSTVFTIVALIFLLLFLPLWPKSHKKCKMGLKILWNFYRQSFCSYWSMLSKKDTLFGCLKKD